MGIGQRLRERRVDVPVLNVAIDIGDGPVVVLLHGIASSSASWRPLVPLVSPLYRVVAIDVLGFGGSRAAEGAAFTLDEHVEALHKTLRGLRIRGRFTLVGHSLGALIAARYAAVHRRDIAQLVLVAPPVYPHRRYLDQLGERMRVGGYLWLFRLVRRNRPAVLGQAGRLRRWLPGRAPQVDAASWAAFALSMQNCIETQAIATDLAHVPAPVDVVYGSRDQVIVPAALERLGAMGHVTLHEVARADHFVREPLAREVARVLR
ncbi:MAG: alpha/beta hydrolase [Herbiconiux sp.]|nr:alpha/beta hydrolase [Herbiconiux sp.]